MLFVLFTFCATMGTGEHYFIDLVLACPFALFMQTLCAWPPAWKNRTALSAMLFALLTVLVWFGALRFAPHFFWISPVIPWVACAGTVALTFMFKQRFDGETSAATPITRAYSCLIAM
jgi:hypothetical protein